MTRTTRAAKRRVSIQRCVMAAISGKQSEGSPATYADVFKFILPKYPASSRDVKQAIERLIGCGAVIRTLADGKVFHLSTPIEGATA